MKAIRLLAATLATAFALPASAAIHELLASFANPPQEPTGRLVRGPDGYWWGTTYYGGIYGYPGTIYKVKADGSDLQTVVSFTGSGVTAGPIKGTNPTGGLVSDGAGFLWGTTSGGPGAGAGTVFKVDAMTGVLTTLVEFSPAGQPRGPLLNDGAGFFWGTTALSGAHGAGSIFKINITTGVFTNVFSFTQTDPNIWPGPRPLVADGTGFLWGTTSQGGVDLAGTIFKVNASTGAVVTVFEFTFNNESNYGVYPAGLVVGGAGFYWGTTARGGANGGGTVFKLDSTTGAITTWVPFSGNGGSYGGTGAGGLVTEGTGFVWGSIEKADSNGNGSVFKFDATTGALTTVLEFTGDGGKNKGDHPGGLVNDGAGFLWGTTFGPAAGTVFKIDANSGQLTTVVELDDKRPREPNAGFVSDSTGLLWGTSGGGGAHGFGTVFTLDPATRAITRVIDFTNTGATNRGIRPNPELVSDGMGHFWGTTSEGAGGQGGTIFKINVGTGELTTLAELTHYPGPQAGLVSDGVGSFWGTTPGYEFPDYGTLFKVNATTGVLTTLIEFTDDGLGAYPGRLVNDGAGFMWVVAGTIFKVNVSTGQRTMVVESNGSQGTYPNAYAGLTDDGLGFLWGTGSGGASNQGTIYKVAMSNGAISMQAQFTGIGGDVKGTNSLNGSHLLNGNDGFLWGQTAYGGASNRGTVYKISRTGAFVNVLDFTGYGSQANTGQPTGSGSLFKHTDGHLYGATEGGGPGGGGTVYRLWLGPIPVTQPATYVGVAIATLNGTVNPNGNTSSVRFQFGTNPALDGATTVSAGTSTAGSSIEPFSLGLSGLSPSTTYYYRFAGLNAENAVTQSGSILSFTTAATAAPLVMSGSAASIRSGGATLGGVVNANAVETFGWFEYGTDTSYGQSTAQVEMGAGTTTNPLNQAVSLVPGTTYHFRTVASNAQGTSYGTDATFTTLTRFQDWELTYLGDVNAEILGDPDGDGVVTLLEFATRSDPLVRNALPGTLARNGSTLEFTYTRAKSAMSDGFNFRVQWCDDLAASNWSSAGVSETILDEDANVQQVKATLPAGNSGRRFVHLEVGKP